MEAIRNTATRIPLFIRVVSFYVLFWLAISLGVHAWPIVHQWINPSETITATVSTQQIKYTPIISKTIIDGIPQTLQIKRLGIDLPIKIGKYDADSNSWTLSEGVVYFADGSTIANNQRGNTFLYGHNRDSTLAPLANLAVGDEAIVKTANGHIFTYLYTGDEYVAPDSTEALYSDPDIPRLTIMMCVGIWSEQRRMMYFNLQEAE